MTQTPRIRRYAMLGASLFALASQMPAIAQETDAAPAAPAETPADSSLKLGSIVVTAQRREESINDVPMSIQAFGEDTLDALRVDSVDDLQSVVPSFSVSQSYQGVPTYTLRGIGFNTINVSATSTVGTYVDEVAYPYPFMNSGPVFDIQRVEVLKGPQGTLFGRNTTAGLINMVTNKPSDQFEGSVSADVGNYDTWNLEGMLNVPLSERAQAASPSAARTVTKAGRNPLRAAKIAARRTSSGSAPRWPSSQPTVSTLMCPTMAGATSPTRSAVRPSR
ncbi:TonB-dependent receptor [Hyphomonas chukchiensis]|uniref:TonB-dependent receptor plug domain-containing protein n=1 Tax=Hyphomonas chukchiensis TaxID=1280947 RepID=A0A062UTF5_9PROT|nr:TonB-dependent receptor plug domain-containing protein [Hyphomonas chukchiensis]KCZ61087.1 hypothetical protein HY30_01725 [Hyphomonas chukchiensis]